MVVELEAAFSVVLKCLCWLVQVLKGTKNLRGVTEPVCGKEMN